MIDPILDAAMLGLLLGAVLTWLLGEWGRQQRDMIWGTLGRGKTWRANRWNWRARLQAALQPPIHVPGPEVFLLETRYPGGRWLPHWEPDAVCATMYSAQQVAQGLNGGPLTWRQNHSVAFAESNRLAFRVRAWRVR